jgi:1,4-dihydroxy-2-naphthoate octaprenyltransferase
MSDNGDEKKSDDKESFEKKAQKAVARKHKVKPTTTVYMILLFASLAIAIYVIEYYQ